MTFCLPTEPHSDMTGMLFMKDSKRIKMCMNTKISRRDDGEIQSESVSHSQKQKENKL